MEDQNHPKRDTSLPQEFIELISKTTARVPLSGESDQYCDPQVQARSETRETLYTNTHERLGINFEVERLQLTTAQTLDPRIVRISPASRNEYHKHAHESLFVILSGHGSILVGEEEINARAGDVVFVPRWVFHQTRNLSSDEELVVLAITDFGFTSSLLGDYDKRTRLKEAGEDVQATGSREQLSTPRATDESSK